VIRVSTAWAHMGDSGLVFNSCLFQVSAISSIALTEDFCGFPQSLYVKNGLVPQTGFPVYYV